ncbi:DDE transposase [Streptomyces spectabilis]|nr:DDE transposase [Streptomyces spectabilis]
MGADRAAAAALAGEVAGPRPVDDRLCLRGILYVLHNGIAWQPLALEPGFGSGQTCRRRRERWQQAEVFDRPHRILPAERNTAGEPDRSRACVHGTPSARKEGGSRHRPVPGQSASGRQAANTTRPATARGPRPRGLHHRGQPQRRHPDSRPHRRHPAPGHPDRPRRRPDSLLGDKGYDSHANRRELRKRRILPVISRKGSPNIKGLGKLRYVVEQTFALLHQFKRLAIRWERRTELHDGFVSLACSLICWRRLKKHRS